MIKKLFLTAVLLAPALAYGGNPSVDLSIQIVPAAAPSVPAAAQAAGFTTLAANYDFTQTLPSNWLGCVPDDGQTHQWYQQGQGNPPPCDVAQVYDAVAGSNVLDIPFKASYGSTYFQNIQTSSTDYTRATTFPNAYWEIVYRTQTSPSVPAPAYEVNGGVTTLFEWFFPGNSSPSGVEQDTVEEWLFYPSSPTDGLLDWNTGASNSAQVFSGRRTFDPTQYHTWAARITSDGTTIAQCSYLDGTQIGCGKINYSTGSEATQRHYATIFAGIGCNFGQPNYGCVNRPITSVYNCSGSICVTVSGVTPGTNFPNDGSGNLAANITGVGGVSGANGAFNIVPNGSDWKLLGTTFSGSYTGGGTFNPYTQLDMYVKSVRVWSCADWATTMCDGTVLTGSP